MRSRWSFDQFSQPADVANHDLCQTNNNINKNKVGDSVLLYIYSHRVTWISKHPNESVVFGIGIFIFYKKWCSRSYSGLPCNV